MAFSGTAANLNWQKVLIALDSLGANGFSRDTLRALKAHLSQVKGNPDLQFIPFTEADCDAAGGTAILTGACKLYAVFVKKEDEGTDNLFLVYDDATNDTTDANAVAALSLKDAKHEVVAAYPNGLSMATGILVTQYTSASGLGKADGSNGGNGFVLIGAA
jgi:hypothetical protein